MKHDARAYKTSPQLQARSIQRYSDTSSKIGSLLVPREFEASLTLFLRRVLSRFVEYTDKRDRNVLQLLT